MEHTARSLLRTYGISEVSGFLPHQPPLTRLPDLYYAPWEDSVRSLPRTVASGSMRSVVDGIEVLSTAKLDSEAEWQRAYVVLTFLAQAYVWGCDVPSQRLPPQLAIPLTEVALHHDLPPIATYSSLALWNFAFQSPFCNLTDPVNLRSLLTVSGTRDEEWFYLISVALESRGGPIILELLNCMHAANQGDESAVVSSLKQTTQNIGQIGELLGRMSERCDPQIYYHDIRPLLAGTKGMATSGLPNGVFFDLGEGQGEWKQYSGGSNGQSSLIQLLDIALGVEHRATGASRGRSHEVGIKSKANGFIQEMRKYMPGPHRRFLEFVEQTANIREYALSSKASARVLDAYNETVTALSKFRDIHIQIVTRYIIMPSKSPRARHSRESKVQNLATACSQASQRATEKPQLCGTGGTDLIPFLKQTRDETKECIAS